tara:strand:+ start:6908 stop:8119 length:1212 start_codon:yes stop_codon:yes gene_type:complete
VKTKRFVFGVLLFAMFLTIGSGFYATARLAGILIAVLALSFLWARVNVRWLDIRIERTLNDVQVNDDIEEKVIVRNLSLLPLPWLFVDDLGNLPRHGLSRVFGIGGWSSLSWNSTTRVSQRGVFTLGPVEVMTSDPLGLFQATRIYGDAQEILVYPETLFLAGFQIPTEGHVGDSSDLRSTRGLTSNVRSVRKYEIGDGLNSVHWKSTARYNQLMVKEFEIERHGGVWIILDMNRNTQEGEGAESTEEYGIKVAASVAHTLLEQGQDVGLALTGDTQHFLHPSNSSSHRLEVLETLARVRADGQMSVQEVFFHIERFLGPSSAVVVISPSGEDLQITASNLIGRNIPGSLVILDSESFSGRVSGSDFANNILAAGMFAYHIRCGDDLQSTLRLNTSLIATGRR